MLSTNLNLNYLGSLRASFPDWDYESHIRWFLMDSSEMHSWRLKSSFCTTFGCPES